MSYQEQISLSTAGNGDLHDVTDQVQRIVTKSKIQTGLVHVFNIGSTASIIHLEWEPGLKKDIPELLNRLIPPSREYGHEQTWHDGNGHSHLQSSLLGPGMTVPVHGGKLLLGTWQQIVHVECDNKPRQRSIAVTVLG